MLTYNSELRPSRPAVSRDFSGLSNLAARSPFSAYGQNHSDVMRGLVADSRNALNMEAAKAESDYTLKQQEVQRQLALAGLKNQAEAEQQDTALATQQMQNSFGLINSVLSGLYR